MSTFTYPGVYIEELSSGVHTITGVATSIAAFVGWAPQGPVTEARLVESWADYQTLYGGLDARSLLGYAVNQFFANGGQQAYIVRLVWDISLTQAPGTNPTPGATALATGVGSASTQITASVGSIVSPPTPLNVGTPVLESIAVTPANLPPIPLGASLTFTATGSSSDGTTSTLAAAVWTSSNPGVIKIVGGGVATAMGAGTAILTATSGLITGTVSVTVTAATLSSIAVSPSAFTLPLGQVQPASGPPLGPTQQLAAIGNYSDGTTQDLTSIATWTSASADAIVTASGLVIAGTTAGGPIAVKAAWVGVSGSSAATIGASVETAIVIQQSAPVIATTQTITFTALATWSDSATPSAIAAGTWTSSNTAVATLAANVATGVAAGPTTITFTPTAGGPPASTTLTVTTATLNSISLTPVNPSVPVGLTLQLKALGIYSDGTTADLTHTVAWSSAVAADAAVDPDTGIVTGKTVAAAVAITATWQGLTPSINVAVVAPVLQSIALTPSASTSILSGATLQFAATGTYSDTSTATLTSTAKWLSSALTTATVNSTGLVTAAAAGGALTLFASNPGAWGNNLRISVTGTPGNPTRFGLLVQMALPSGQLTVLESYVNLSVTPTDPLYAVTVIDNDSNYISFINLATGLPVVPAAAPSPTPANAPIALSGGADGSVLTPASDQNFEIALTSNATAGVFLLDRVDIFNLLCIPAETDAPTIQTLQEYCAKKRAFYIVDSWELSTTSNLIQSGPVGSTAGSLTGQYSSNSAFYFPWVQAPDPLFGNRPTLFPPCGFVAGIYAATDASRNVWKAPAGINASLTGVLGLQTNLTDLENGQLNIQAINCLRQFKVYGDVVWGARTLQGSDQAGSEWKYIPIRRLALYIESSLYDGTQWVVFEPNDVPLWSQIRLNVGAFMQGLFLQGAFQGTTPQQAYFVKCDAENNPQSSIDLGIVNILVGFAPLYPAEFVVIQIQQMAGQLS